jgi:hypothetical protein
VVIGDGGVVNYWHGRPVGSSDQALMHAYYVSNKGPFGDGPAPGGTGASAHSISCCCCC